MTRLLWWWILLAYTVNKEPSLDRPATPASDLSSLTSYSPPSEGQISSASSAVRIPHTSLDTDAKEPIMETSQAPTKALGALGANFNERYIWIDDAELKAQNVQWVRGFTNMYRPNLLTPLKNRNIKALMRAVSVGYKTILSLKWDYKEEDYPLPGSPEYEAQMERLHHLLPVVMGKVDILVIGNEPFLEVKPEQRNERLNEFYESMAEAVIAFHKKTYAGTDSASSNLRVKTKLYMGSFNRLNDPAWRTPAVERMLKYIASKPELDGIDLHLHTPALAGHRKALNYALPFLRPDQKFLSTEFSLIWHWYKNMKHPVSEYYCNKHNLPLNDTKVLDVINAAILNPMSYDQWEDFLRHEEWFMEKETFLKDAINLYRKTGRLEVATYCWSPMMDRKKPLEVGETPWMFYGVYCPPTVKRKEEDGTRYEAFLWAEQFRNAA